ncbi:hypothetical protein F5Y00DRAFT_249943 [Daldinia vernicosa]|uniref:uncharacterized protein n=1 Tax=Daldinia vernicosa TaxID=114800 RepID=UPI0020084475|nr:uncharacterized protein F5Y00DRAFT_249943 [Daldinia vernicosa]KAI0843911.1 hypothetical protein F5Y00DRAFT_249943 [Daldinia vernicosa]
MASPRETLLTKFEVCLYKKHDISYEDFVEWTTKVYPPKAISIIKKHGIVKWAQIVTPPTFREPFRQTLKDMGRLKWTAPDYDLVMSVWLRSIDDMLALYKYPKWIELEEEAELWCNVTIGHSVIGHEIAQI